MTSRKTKSHVDHVRRFNRFYTQQIGVLNEGLLKSPFSLTELRVLYEIAHRERPTAAEIGKALGLDPGYLSRILRSFEKRGLIQKKRSDSDGRQTLLEMTAAGQKEFAALDTRQNDDVQTMIEGLPESDRNRLVDAMRTIEALVGGDDGLPEAKTPYILRAHQPGDMGWVVHRHGVLYSQEYGWNEWFEGLVAGIVSKFIENYDPKRERCWIAEKDGEIVGFVFLVSQSKTVAKLRMLLVEPKARGLGIGRRLVDECIRFSRQAGYRKIMLWTNSALRAARHLYEEAGFELVRTEQHEGFKKGQMSETWELVL